MIIRYHKLQFKSDVSSGTFLTDFKKRQTPRHSEMYPPEASEERSAPHPTLGLAAEANYYNKQKVGKKPKP